MTLAHRLAAKGLLKDADLPRVDVAAANAPDKPLHEILIENGYAKEDDVLKELADEFGLEVVDLTQIKVDAETIKSVPLRLVHRRNVMPISRDNGTLTVATGNPYDVYALDELQTITGLHVQPVIASPKEISRLIRTHFGVGGDTVSAMVQDRATDAVELSTLR